ncbi:sulfonate transport system substrate-binding protein [Saccharothrix tamanrassetensis]|uniref:Sulfonate transport system substrate-binding protein n=1 Tax=Saccharothrix tamanrassetensis TaxID=1051531 RepID=A0A841C720_9PSEU|nr:ABC transporter substrate-binding protein [Saccharothrix tamanrassetensis]MBB5954312.1 sulfonate transport system substrate-binding protein [Saccharothrix tamanrassetensis]
MTVRVGFFPHNNSLFVLRHTGILERRLPDVTWVDLRALPQGDRPDPRSGLPSVHSDQLFADGGYDVIGTGFTPPITALGAGRDVVYLGVSGPRTENGRLVVPADSPIRQVADLRGRRVGIAHGSWQTTLLLFALDQTGLTWADVEPVNTGADAAQLFLDGRIDAWTGSYPDLDRVEARTGVRTLVRTEGLFSHPSLWFTRRDFAETHRAELAAIVESLQESDRWITDNPRAAAQYFVDDAVARGEDADLDAWERALRNRPFGVNPVDDTFLEEQQRAADLLTANGLLPRAVNVRDAVLPWVNDLVAGTLPARA